MPSVYRTAQIAKRIGIHPNTVRFYEEIGLLTPPRRLANGYRVYTDMHVKQLELIRLILRAEVLVGGLRKQAFCMLRRCAARDFDGALEAARTYRRMLDREIDRANGAIRAVEAMLAAPSAESDARDRNRGQVAEALGITVDALRNWEMNGLIAIKRDANGYRVYGDADMARLCVIRALRGAHYSLTAILRLLEALDSGRHVQIGRTLDTVAADAEIVSVCDRLRAALGAARLDADRAAMMLRNMKSLYKTLQ